MQKATNGALLCMKLQTKIDGGSFQVEKLFNTRESKRKTSGLVGQTGDRSIDMERIIMEEHRAAAGVNCLNDGKRNRRSEARSCVLSH